MNKVDWKQKLTSRKFWAVVTGFATSILVAFNVNNLTIEQVLVKYKEEVEIRIAEKTIEILG